MNKYLQGTRVPNALGGSMHTNNPLSGQQLAYTIKSLKKEEETLNY